MNTAGSEQHHAALFDKRLFAGGRSLLASQAIRLGLRVVSTVLMARMLSPTDYGIFGMALVVYGLFYAIRDVGLSTVTVSRHSVTDDEISALFWINVVVGMILTVVFSGLGPALAAIDSEPRLKVVFPALGACYLINALGAQPQAVLSREMRFVTLSVIEVASMVGCLAVALGAAWAGAGYWALVYMAISAEVVRLAGLWWACRWRPGRWPGWSGLREMLGLGARLTGFNTLNYLAVSADQFLVGVWMGSKPLGLYGRASQMTSLPAQFLMNPLNGWMVAALSRLKQEPERYASLNRQVMNAVAQLVFPLSMGLIAAPAPIITLALGAKWVGAASALRWLALGLMVQPLLFAQNWLMMSQGHGGRLCVLATANFAALLALCVAMRAHGIEGIASATAIAAIAVSLPGIYWATRQSPVALSDAARALRRPFLLAVAFGVTLGGALRAIGAASNGHTLISLVAATAVWASLALAWRSARREWFDAARAFGTASGKLST